MAVAIVRRKVCECRGRASILVTKEYAVRTYIVCAVPTVTMVIILLTVTQKALDNNHLDHEKNLSSTSVLAEEIFGTHYYSYQLCKILLISLFPLIMGCFCYLRIFYVVRQAAQSMGNFINQRNRNPSKLITVSVIVLLNITLLTWLVYIITSSVAFSSSISDHVFMYMKTIIFLLYPIGEGLFLGSTKSALSQSNSVFTNRTRTRISPVMEEGSGIDATSQHTLKGVMTVTLSEMEDSNVSACVDTDSSNGVGSDTALTTAIGRLYEQKPSTSDDYAEVQSTGQKPFIKTSHSMDDIEEETSDFKPFSVAALFRRRGSAFADYKSVERDSPVAKKKKARHTFESMRPGYSRATKKYSEPPLFGIGRRRSIQTPELSPLGATHGFFSNRLFENLPESPELRNKIDSPIATQEGYSGLQYAKQSDNEVLDTSNYTGIVAQRRNRKSKTGSRWLKVLPLIRKQSPLNKGDNEQTVFGSAPRTLAEQSKHRGPHKRLLRQTSKHIEIDAQQVQTFTTVSSRTPIAKTRSISCVNNVYMEAQRTNDLKGNKTKKRNKSVSFMSSVYIDDTGSQPRGRVEVDSEINFKFRKGIRKLNSEDKSSSFDLSKIIKRKTSHWMLEKTTSRHECILKLQEINEYF